mmetsp:Transcript_56075/g.141954  ORF Transcript_56075/g.141954 Transcript_56075/m.141954 type:complete len:198 (+) Transcript_56075:108-701(+)
MLYFASLGAWLVLSACVTTIGADDVEESMDDTLCALQTKQRVVQAGTEHGCDPEELTGVYHDLHDNNNKIVNVTSQFAMTITPPVPGSPFYVDGVGIDWIVTPADVGPITPHCFVTSIDFNVPNKPDPPDGNVTARFMSTELMSVSWIADCGPTTVGSDACGQCGADPVRSWEGDQQMLLFGSSLLDAGNVWVKIHA